MTVERLVAELRVRGEFRRVFAAIECRLDPPFVHATGRWRWRVGLNYAELRFSGLRRYTWHASDVERVAWVDVDVEAAT